MSISLKIGMVEKDLAMFKEIITVLNIGRIDGPYKNVKGQPVVFLIFNRKYKNKYYSLYLFTIKKKFFF